MVVVKVGEVFLGSGYSLDIALRELPKRVCEEHTELISALLKIKGLACNDSSKPDVLTRMLLAHYVLCAIGRCNMSASSHDGRLAKKALEALVYDDECFSWCFPRSLTRSPDIRLDPRHERGCTKLILEGSFIDVLTEPHEVEFRRAIARFATSAKLKHLRGRSSLLYFALGIGDWAEHLSKLANLKP